MLAIDFPVPIFFDTDGSPLDDGMLYFGAANQNPETSPVTVYWDAAGTQPAAQPIRTKNGYPSRAGSQAVVYVSTTHSMTVKNARGALVMYSPVSTDYNAIEQAVAEVDALDASLRNATNAAKGAGQIAMGALSYPDGSIGARLAGDVYPTEEPFNGVLDGTADDTTAVQAALTYCSANGKTLVIPHGRTASISSVTVANGLAGIICDGVIKGRGVAAVATIVCGSSGNGVKNAHFKLRMDMSAGDGIAVKAWDMENCSFERGHIYGFTNDATDNHYFFWGQDSCKWNKFIGNRVDMYPSPTQRGFGVAFYGGPGTALDYGGFFDGVVSRAQFPCIGNLVAGNTFNDGSYAVSIQYSEYNIVSGNYCNNQNHRSIYIAAAAWGNVVSSNVFREFLSTAVLMGYSASNNEVSGNLCETSFASGEAAINLNTGCRDNKISGNKIIAGCNYGIYLACDAVGNEVTGNKISNHFLAGIAIENDWKSPRPTNAIFSRPNYGDPPSPYTAWSSVNTSDNVVKGNTIGAGYAGRNTAAIAVAQIDAAGGTSVTNNVISGNHVISGTNIAYNLHFYADTAANLTGTVLTGNNFHPDNSELVIHGASAGTWSGHVAYYADNREFDDELNKEPIAIADGDTTPSVITNSAVPNERLYAFNNTSATSVTDFDDGKDGQHITLRLSANTTIVYTSGIIRPKGLVNVVGTSQNQMIQFRKIGSIWYETWRNF